MTAVLVPLMARGLIDFSHQPDHLEQTGWLSRLHGRLLALFSRRPLLLLPVGLPLLATGWLAYQHVPTGFMPKVDEGGFVLDYYTAAGTSLDETDREVAQVDAILRALPETQTFSRRLGTGLGGDLGESYHGDYFVKLKDGHLRSTATVMTQVLARIQAEVPGLQVDTAQPMEDLIGDLTGAPQPIEIKLYGEETAPLIPVAKAVAAAIGRITGVVEVNDGVKLAGDGFGPASGSRTGRSRGNDGRASCRPSN